MVALGTFPPGSIIVFGCTTAPGQDKYSTDVTDGSTCNLIVRDVTHTDAGRYRCSIGAATFLADLVVVSTIANSTNLTTPYPVYEESVSMTCSATSSGCYKAIIEWVGPDGTIPGDGESSATLISSTIVENVTNQAYFPRYSCTLRFTGERDQTINNCGPAAGVDSETPIYNDSSSFEFDHVIYINEPNATYDNGTQVTNGTVVDLGTHLSAYAEAFPSETTGQWCIQNACNYTHTTTVNIPGGIYIYSENNSYVFSTFIVIGRELPSFEPNCTNETCLNNGTCIEHDILGFICKCPKEYCGRKCKLKRSDYCISYDGSIVLESFDCFVAFSSFVLFGLLVWKSHGQLVSVSRFLLVFLFCGGLTTLAFAIIWGVQYDKDMQDGLILPKEISPTDNIEGCNFGCLCWIYISLTFFVVCVGVLNAGMGIAFAFFRAKMIRA